MSCRPSALRNVIRGDNTVDYAARQVTARLATFSRGKKSHEQVGLLWRAKRYRFAATPASNRKRFYSSQVRTLIHAA